MLWTTLLTIGWAATVFAQVEDVQPEEAVTSVEEADRAYVRSFLQRDDVRTAARIANADLDEALNRVDTMEGERLERATRQARALENHLEARQDGISLSVTSIIVILVLVLVIVIVA